MYGTVLYCIVTGAGAATKGVLEDNLHTDVVEPPKFITGIVLHHIILDFFRADHLHHDRDVHRPRACIDTARHIAAVFEKLGYDPAGGHRIFAAMSEVSNMRFARWHRKI
jgi:hypothetical protein